MNETEVKEFYRELINKELENASIRELKLILAFARA